MSVFDLRNIMGSGKGGEADTPVEADNTLISYAQANIVEVLGEGPIEGLVIPKDGEQSGKRSVYLDETPLMDSDGNLNFSGVRYQVRKGYEDQELIKEVPAIEAETIVNQEVTHAASVTQTIADGDFDDIRIKIMMPSCLKVDTSTGDIGPTSVQLKISVKLQSAGSWTLARTKTIRGKTNTTYEEAIRLKDINQYGEPTPGDTWQVKVERVTADHTGSEYQDKTWWSSYTTILNERFIWPNIAYVAMQIDAKRFGTHIPVRAYEVRGRIIKVPSNMDHCCWDREEPWSVGHTIYSGAWDGTFKWAYSNDPAWCFYDLITNARYGLGADNIRIDKYALYSISKYCLALNDSGQFVGVDDGSGGKEPRFTLNICLETEEEAYHLLNALASSFMAMPYWSSGSLSVSQDAPADATHLANNTNVINGEFHYSGVGLRATHSVACVTWNDPDDGYRPAVEMVEYPDLIASIGWKPLDIVAVGCTSQGQAHRIGRAHMEAEANGEVVTFVGSFYFADCVPGSIIKIQDPAYSGIRFGGRVDTGATTTSIPIDSSVTIDGGESYTLTLVVPGVSSTSTTSVTIGEGSKTFTTQSGKNYQDDEPIRIRSAANKTNYMLGTVTSYSGTTLVVAVTETGGSGAHTDWEISSFGRVESQSVSNTPGATTILTVSSAFSHTPEKGTFWILTGTTYVPREFRCISNVEKARNQFEVTAIYHDPTKYARIDADLSLDTSMVHPTIISIRNAYYKWTASAHGTNEYYLELSAGGDPGINEPSKLLINNSSATKGTVGSLSAGRWGWGINDSQDYPTVYVRLSGGGDPDSEAVDYIKAKYRRIVLGPIRPPSNIDVKIFTHNQGRNHAIGVQLSWKFSRDPRVVFYDVDYRVHDDGDWRKFGKGETTTSSIEKRVISAGEYDFRIRARGIGASAWYEESGVTIADPNDLPPDVTNLVTKDDPATGVLFIGKECEVEWDDMADGSVDYYPENRHRDYRVRIYSTGDVLKRTKYIRKNQYVYTENMNKKDFGGSAARSFKVSVECRDTEGRFSTNPTVITVSKTQVDFSGTAPTLAGTHNGVEVDLTTFVAIDDQDLLQMYVYCDTSNPPTTLKKIVGAHTKHVNIRFHPTTGATYYVKVTPHDMYGAGIASDIGSVICNLTPLESQLAEAVVVLNGGVVKTDASPNPRIEYGAALLAGYSDATTKEWWLDASTGICYFGAGEVRCDSDGITIQATDSFVKKNAITWESDVDQVVRVYGTHDVSLTTVMLQLRADGSLTTLADSDALINALAEAGTGKDAKVHLNATNASSDTASFHLECTSAGVATATLDADLTVTGTATHEDAIIVETASTPSAVTDGFCMYSADVSAGNAGPRFLLEGGDIVKLYQTAALTAPNTDTVDATYGTEERDCINNTRTRVNQLEDRLQNLGLLG